MRPQPAASMSAGMRIAVRIEEVVDPRRVLHLPM